MIRTPRPTRASVLPVDTADTMGTTTARPPPDPDEASACVDVVAVALTPTLPPVVTSALPPIDACTRPLSAALVFDPTPDRRATEPEIVLAKVVSG